MLICLCLCLYLALERSFSWLNKLRLCIKHKHKHWVMTQVLSTRICVCVKQHKLCLCFQNVPIVYQEGPVSLLGAGHWGCHKSSLGPINTPSPGSNRFNKGLKPYLTIKSTYLFSISIVNISWSGNSTEEHYLQYMIFVLDTPLSHHLTRSNEHCDFSSLMKNHFSSTCT